MRPFPQSCCMSSLQHGVLPTQNVPALRVPPSVTGPTSTFSVFLRGARGHTHPPKNTYFHIDTCTRVCRQLQVHKKHLGIFPDTVHEPVLDSLSHFFGKTFLISKCKKKKETLYVATSSREEEKSPTSHLVAGDITEIWQEFSGSFLPFLSSGYWSPILGSYLHSGPSPMGNITSSF